MPRATHWITIGRIFPKLAWLGFGIAVGDKHDVILIIGLGPWAMIIGPHYAPKPDTTD